MQQNKIATLPILLIHNAISNIFKLDKILIEN